MNKFLTVLAALLLVLCLSACKQDSPDTSGGNVSSGTVQQENNLVTPSTQPQGESSTPAPDSQGTGDYDLAVDDLPPENIGAAEVNVLRMNEIVKRLNLIYGVEEFPVFYPVGDDSLNAFRDWLTEVNDVFEELQFDIYSIVPRTYGYSVSVSNSEDPWYHPYQIFFEVLPEDTELPRNTVVSLGEDGELNYQGAGVDYTDVGFGDDVIKFVTYNFD